MGGYTGAIVDVAKNVIEGIGNKIGRSSEATAIAHEVEQGVFHGMFNPAKAFDATPATKELWKDMGTFRQLTDKHQNFLAQQAKATGSTRPFEDIAHEAKKTAMAQVFGPNREVIQGVLRDTQQKAGVAKSNIIANHLQILFKEPLDDVGHGKFASKFSTDMAKGGEERAVSVPQSTYKRPSNVENFIRSYQKTLAYKAALPHAVGNVSNILMSDGLLTLAKSAYKTFGPGSKAAEAVLMASGHIPEIPFNEYKMHQMFQRGMISKYASGSIGEFLHKNMYMPGMSAVRRKNIIWSAHASMLAAQEAAQNLTRGNDRKAIPILHELGLDYRKIKVNNGQFDPQDIEKIYYKGVDTRAFLNISDRRNVLWQRSATFRLTGAFHSFITAQSQFIRNTIRRQYVQGDIVGAARTLATIGLVLPTAGITVHEAERWLRGKDLDDPAGHLGRQLEGTLGGEAYDAIVRKQNATSMGKATLNTIDGLADAATFGVASSFMNGIMRSHLSDVLLGPTGNQIVQGAQDTGKLLHYDSHHPDAWKPLARDVLQGIPSLGLGGIVGDKLIPTKADQVHRFKRQSSRRKTGTTWNPFNDSFDY